MWLLRACEHELSRTESGREQGLTWEQEIGEPRLEDQTPEAYWWGEGQPAGPQRCAEEENKSVS